MRAAGERISMWLLALIPGKTDLVVSRLRCERRFTTFFVREDSL